MPLNPLQFLVYAGALFFFWLGRRVALAGDKSPWVGGAFFLLAVPALCYDLYYLRVWEEPMWLYRIRSWPASELLAAPAGLFAGWAQGRLQGRWRVSVLSASVLMLLGLTVPYVKQLAAPVELSEKWRDGVCLQSSPSTCGPASAATLLTALGVPTLEAEIARDAFTTWSGTENWYLRRAIERRGIKCDYAWITPPVTRLPHPSIAGLKLGGDAGHFVAVLDEDAEGYVIADPLYGRSKVTKAALAKGGTSFSGFFLVLSKPEEAR
jgi:hypothetical protein